MSKRRQSMEFEPLSAPGTIEHATTKSEWLPQAVDLIGQATAAHRRGDARALELAMTALDAWRNGVKDGSTIHAWRERMRREASEQSRRVVRGHGVEQFAPFVAEFPFAPYDSRFLGTPVDYIVFDGLYADTVSRIVLVEVKSGDARLTARERSVRDAVKAGRVEWREVRAESPAKKRAPDEFDPIDFSEFEV